MKKIVVSGLALVFLLGASGAAAGVEKNGIDFSRPIKVDDLKIEKKLILSKEQRALGEKGSKGKPTPPPVTVEGATGVLGTPLALGAKKYAILVGLSNYAGTANDLCIDSLKTTANYPNSLCADADAANMELTLKDKYGYNDTNSTIWRFSDADANFAAIQSAKDYILANAKAGDEVVFFFSGHSATSNRNLFKNGDRLNVGLALYNLPYDSREVIWDGYLQNWFGSLATNRIVFIFDTCHAGGLASYLQGTGREVVMSSAENQYSYTYYLGGESNMLGEGSFAHFFNVDGMYNGLADGYNMFAPNGIDGKVAVEEAYSYAKKFVPIDTSNHQIPALNDKFTDDLMLGY
ncbi:MAG: caspase family protein [Parcubacteria group bacterium]|jgi:hypothetical protein